MPRKTVITSYNTKSYQVDGLSWESTPKSHVFKWKKNNQELETNMIEYMKVVHKVKIGYTDQPLLFVNFKDIRVYLPPELCHEAALPDNFTTDARKMRDIDEYKIKSPNERFTRIIDVLNRIFNAPEFDQYSILL